MTLLATTDVHGNVMDWDYFCNRPASELYGTGIGLARAAGIVAQVRQRCGPDSVVLVDNGDTLQGTPVAYYYARVEPVTATGLDHPLAVAYNTIGYDAQVIGNHDFNYGLDLLAAYAEDLAYPLLGANVLDVSTGEPVLQPYVLLTRRVAGHGGPVTVGILGLTTPGSMVWDRDVLAGRITIEEMSTAAAAWVPRMRAAGADVVVVLSHSGIGSTAYDSTGLGVENAADRIAEVPGIDAIVVGHTHSRVEAQYLTNPTTGARVLLTQPLPWAQEVAEITFRLERGLGRWEVVGVDAVLHDCATVAPEEAVAEAVRPYHEVAVAYVNQVVATCPRALPADTSHYEDTPILDFVQAVQTRVVADALADGPYGRLPVLSTVAPFSRTAVLPAGEVSIRDLAGLYLYDNTLGAVLVTGAQLREYLEYSAKYYGSVPVGEEFDPAVHTGVVYDGVRGWDYNYDIIAGVDYRIDLSRPVGDRIVGLELAGRPVTPAQRFVLAVNSYRRAGGGNFPYVASAPVVYDEQREIRQLLIDWATSRGVIDAADFFTPNWALVIGDRPAVRTR